jgi:hypothetical protein
MQVFPPNDPCRALFNANLINERNWDNFKPISLDHTKYIAVAIYLQEGFYINSPKGLQVGKPGDYLCINIATKQKCICAKNELV